MTDKYDLGPCCGCGKPNDETVRNMMHLTFEAPEGFSGWGCVVCGVPARGAIAILCDDCIDELVRRVPVNGAEPKFIAGGAYLTDRVRVPLDGYVRKPFDHIRERHPEACP